MNFLKYLINDLTAYKDRKLKRKQERVYSLKTIEAFKAIQRAVRQYTVSLKLYIEGLNKFFETMAKNSKFQKKDSGENVLPNMKAKDFAKGLVVERYNPKKYERKHGPSAS